MGCANKAKPVEFPEGTNAGEEMSRLENDIQQGELDQIDITSPDYFSLAKRKLAEARKMESQGKSNKKILKTLGEARGDLNYAVITQQNFRGELDDILSTRQTALKAGALEQYPSEFQRTDWDLKNAVKNYKPNKDFLSYSVHEQFKNKYARLHQKALANAEENKEFNREEVAVEEVNFNPDEADIINNGEQITIRLKGNNFNPGEAQFSKKAVPALEKVKKLLSSMNQEQVKIEGFTDSTGSTELNQQLSEKRAEAVADYLISPDSSITDQIEYEGLGSKKPVTTNITKEGRAANRRVDIIITPSKIE